MHLFLFSLIQFSIKRALKYDAGKGEKNQLKGAGPNWSGAEKYEKRRNDEVLQREKETAQKALGYMRYTAGQIQGRKYVNHIIYK